MIGRKRSDRTSEKESKRMILLFVVRRIQMKEKEEAIARTS